MLKDEEKENEEEQENKKNEKRNIWRRMTCIKKHTHTHTYRVIQNDCRGFNNLSYTVHLK
jgi:hypothetical protein